MGARRGPGTSATLRPEIASSWRRAAMLGVDRETPHFERIGEVDGASRLMVAAAPVLHDLAERLVDTPFSLLLADRECRIVHQWSGDRRLRRALDSVGLVVGSDLDESTAGTTALGTPFELGRGVTVRGQEHYLHVLGGFSCYGQPIRHPLTGRVEGVLDITAPDQVFSPLCEPLIARAVQDIEARIVERARAVERELFLAFQAATRRRSSPIAVLGGDVVLANRSCLDRLGSTDPSMLRALLPQIPARGTLSREVDLGPAGRVLVVAERVAGTADGALFHLEDLGPRERATPNPPPARTGPVLVAGEPGTGRSTVAARIVGDASVATIDAAESLTGSERAWAARCAELAAAHDALVVDDVQLLGERLATVVRRMLGRTRVVMTSCPLDELPPAATRLAARCAETVELAPLRERLGELPGLVRAIAAEVRGTLDVTPAALAALAAQPWPGNLTELVGAVTEIATRPGGGRVDVADLPRRYRPVPRASRLGGRERAERAAIIAALQSAAGNKLRAAEELGISRTTLYRRMRVLQVTDA